MSTANERILGLCLMTAALSIVPFSHVQAGVNVAPVAAEEPVPSASVGAAELSRAAADSRKARKPRVSLKCYQEGRLIHESTDVNLAERQSAALTLSSSLSGQPAVQVIDLKSGLCLIETRAP